LREVLEEEGVQVIRYEEDDSREETLVCWVLVDPDHCHDFLRYEQSLHANGSSETLGVRLLCMYMNNCIEIYA
jgi:hypothetical protein